MENIGIYVHIPFCAKKCYYCDFVSFSDKKEKQKDYVQKIEEEIVGKSKEIKNYIDTIYIGGGTPSIINCQYIVDILNCIKENYKVKKNAEITIEINPGTITEEKLIKFKEAGINRTSVNKR